MPARHGGGQFPSRFRNLHFPGLDEGKSLRKFLRPREGKGTGISRRRRRSRSLGRPLLSSVSARELFCKDAAGDHHHTGGAMREPDRDGVLEAALPGARHRQGRASRRFRHPGKRRRPRFESLEQVSASRSLCHFE